MKTNWKRLLVNASPFLLTGASIALILTEFDSPEQNFVSMAGSISALGAAILIGRIQLQKAEQRYRDEYNKNNCR